MRSHGCFAMLVGTALRCLAVISVAQPAWAQPSQAGTELNRPAYQIRRFDEDWSVLKGVGPERDG
jgi:hypothetical protein